MQKTVPLLLWLLLLGTFCKAQTGPSKIDSLLALLKKEKQDTAKVNKLNELAMLTRQNNPDTSLYYASRALELATQQNYPYGIATANLWIGASKATAGNVFDGLKNLNIAANLYESILPGKHHAHDINTNKGITYNLIGIAYLRMGNYPESLKNLLVALKLREQLNDKIGISYTENNLGIIYFQLGNYYEAIKYYTSALKTRIELDDKDGIASSYNNIAIVYYWKENLTEAINYYNKSLAICRELKDVQGIAGAYLNISEVFQKQKKYDEALKEGLAALALLDGEEEIARCQNSISNTYFFLENYRLAHDYATKGLGGAQKTGSMELIAEGNKSLMLIDSAQGNYKDALIHYKQYIIYRDSMYNEENTKKIVQSQMQYDFDKKEAATKADQDIKDVVAQKELQKQKLVRNGFISGFVIVLLFAGVFFTQRNKIKEGKKRSDELLLNILPSEVAEELKEKGSADAKQFDEVTVMFTDFKGFTQISEKLSAKELVAEIHTCFKAFDDIISKHNIEKIKTIGDSYMCAGGLPVANTTHADDVVKAALEINTFMLNRKSESVSGGLKFEIRIGIHTGTVVAGIVGVKKFAYDIWGDTVNIASRMESSGEAGKVNISGSTYQLVKEKFNCVHRGKIQAKNKGEIDMYFVETV